jgi:hypothetical protein
LASPQQSTSNKEREELIALDTKQKVEEFVESHWPEHYQAVQSQKTLLDAKYFVLTQIIPHSTSIPEVCYAFFSLFCLDRSLHAFSLLRTPF